MSAKEDNTNSSVPAFTIHGFETWHYRITRCILGKAEGQKILTQDAPVEIPLPVNPTAQQRRDSEKREEEIEKWKIAESKAVALLSHHVHHTLLVV